jgi:N-acetylglucosamine kinase-like BadF-type ATPase
MERLLPSAQDAVHLQHVAEGNADVKQYVGIDGGGTKSRIAVMDESGRILVRKEGACTNQYAIGFPQAVEHVRDLVGSTVDLSCVAGFCLASAGLGRKPEAERFATQLAYPFPCYYCSDVEALLVGGLQNEEGICLVCGTGSVAMGRTRDGIIRRSGGFGWRLGDEGSAWWQGQQAIQRAMRSEEHRDLPTKLLVPVMQALSVDTMEGLITLCNADTLTKARIASLSPLVTEYAKRGDPLAVDIINLSVKELTLLVDAIVVQLPLLEGRDVVCAGGVLEHDAYFVSLLRQTWGTRYRFVQPKGTALDGALALAKQITTTSR